MRLPKPMNAKELAQYIEKTNGVSKPWLLVQLRLKKLEESRDRLSPTEYLHHLEDIHQDMMNLGEWWIDREQEVFGEG